MRTETIGDATLKAPREDLRVVGNRLVADGGRVLGEFSGHWPAVAAMIRMNDPGFRSLGGDRADDLAEEARVHAAEAMA